MMGNGWQAEQTTATLHSSRYFLFCPFFAVIYFYKIKCILSAFALKQLGFFFMSVSGVTKVWRVGKQGVKLVLPAGGETAEADI